ncbi:MAG: glycosyltransferase family 2 protein [Nitrososphaeria archaeon]
MQNLPFVSIIIVNYNGKWHLEECLPSLESLDYPEDKFEIILVDNCSKDGSVEFVKEKFPRVKILRLDKNYGFCKPNNEGAKIAKGKYLAFINNDTIVDKNWLRELVNGTQKQPNILCCASKILYYDRRNIINAAGGKITPIGGGFYIGYGEKDREEFSKFTYTGFGCGAGVLIDADFFRDIGGFDEDYFASGEEQELGLRVWMCGYRVLYVPKAIIYHKESGTYGTKGTFQPVKVYLITRNRLYNLLKNFELKNILLGFIIGLLFDLHRLIIYLLSQNSALVMSIFRAYLHVAKNLKKTLKKRKIIQSKRKLSDKELYKLGVIASLKECIIEEKRLLGIFKTYANLSRRAV